MCASNLRANMQLYVFPCMYLKNVRIGYENDIWAVAPKSLNRPDILTKAQKMLPGSHGVIYCSELQQFAVPFITRSTPTHIITERADNLSDTQPFKLLYTKLQVCRAHSYIFTSQNAVQSHIDNLHAPSRRYR
jgi:hypothetical protein